jgi:hypothetical protein
VVSVGRRGYLGGGSKRCSWTRENEAVDSQHGTGVGGNLQPRTKSYCPTSKVFFICFITTHTLILYVALKMLVLKTSIFSLCRLKINHLMDLQDVRLFLGPLARLQKQRVTSAAHRVTSGLKVTSIAQKVKCSSCVTELKRKLVDYFSDLRTTVFKLTMEEFLYHYHCKIKRFTDKMSK